MSVYQTRLRPGGIFGLIGSLLILAGCATHHSGSTTVSLPDEGPFRVEQDLRFSPDGWPEALFADLYLPTGQVSEARHPVVLMVHGGGWQRRSREDMAWIAEEVASHGLAVLNIDSRLAPAHTFPAQLYDLQLARQWLNRHADEYQLDAARVSGFGFSSGAHLIALLALVASSDRDMNQPHGGPDTRLRAVCPGGQTSGLTAVETVEPVRPCAWRWH